VQTSATLEGVELQNANGESCGGTLKNTFAHSCNSVFAPLGAKAGAGALVKAAEEFGFNEDPGIPGAATSTIPAANDIGDDLAVGSTAIGQGVVQATALMMAWVAATVADGGERPKLTLELGAQPQRTRVMSEQVAATVGEYMRAVVTDGTGVAASAGGVAIAGKTGTAELRRTQGCTPSQGVGAVPETCSDANDPSDTTAWFSAFAPLKRPRVAVGVVLPGGGTGGETAAPAARDVILATLKEGSQQAGTSAAPGA
jgi:cell division protein FtsI/penicillin-binding protein 2